MPFDIHIVVQRPLYFEQASLVDVFVVPINTFAQHKHCSAAAVPTHTEGLVPLLPSVLDTKNFCGADVECYVA